MRVEVEDQTKFGFQIAPIIDVVFILIIFFMVSVALNPKDRFLDMTLPGRTTGEGTLSPPIELTIQGNGTVLWNGMEIGSARDGKLDGLTSKLQRAVALFGEEQPVIITPAPSTSHSRVIEALDSCAAANVKAVSFAR